MAQLKLKPVLAIVLTDKTGHSKNVKENAERTSANGSEEIKYAKHCEQQRLSLDLENEN